MPSVRNNFTQLSTATVLVLGAGVMQVPLIQAAKKLGCYVIASDANSRAPGCALADYFFQIDLRDYKAMSNAARNFGRSRRPIDGVVTAGTDFSYSVAYIAHKLGLTGITRTSARNATNKYYMRRVLRRAGVSTPRFCLARTGHERFLDGLNYPLVIKPVDNMGSRGVQRIDSSAHLISAVQQAIEFSAVRRVIIEEFISGQEYSLDALVYRGTFIPCGIAVRHIQFPPYFVEMGHTIPAPVLPEENSELLSTFARAVKALKIDCGAAKGDLFLNKGNVIVGEIAARLSGGYMSGWSYPLSSGVHPAMGAVEIALGRPPSRVTASHNYFVAERAIVSIPGKVFAVEGQTEITQLPGVRHCFLRVATGDTVRFPRNNVEKCANVIVTADSRDVLERRVQRALCTLTIRLEASHQDTYDFLFTTREVPPSPSAYTLNNTSDFFHYFSILNNKTKPITSANNFPLICVVLLSSIQFVADKEGWHPLSLRACLGSLCDEYQLKLNHSFPKKNQSLCPAPPAFWRAILKGGLQGGRFFFDTLRCGDVSLIKALWNWRGSPL